jgi:hypothetical protein
VYACINGGGNHPQAANKETVNAEVFANGSFEPRNGRVQASLTAGPPSASAFSCPSGQRLVLASVSYTNIVLAHTTNGVSTTVPDASRTFFTF